MWFGEYDTSKIGRITTSGQITEFNTLNGGGRSSSPFGITAGPDGAIWFAELTASKIGRITTSGVVSEFSTPTPNSQPIGITVGADGALWFTEQLTSKIGRIAITPEAIPDQPQNVSATLSGSQATISWDPLPKTLSVEAGANHTCAVIDGAAKCWGYNNFGELGNGTYTNSNTPVQVQGLTSGVKAVAAGGDFSCALSNNGGVTCWGFGSYGQLGNNNNASSSVPVQVSGLTSGVTAISAGYYSMCALVNGSVQCWGLNYNQVPTPIGGLSSNVTQVSAGWLHACALDATAV
jgi:hypothetical protein